MSHSITDLRELKEKPKKHFSANDESDEFQLEIKERRIDMYIAEIEMEPLFQLGSTIRAIYDGDEHDRFMEKLDQRIKNHDKDIERMCNCHYQGFVDCIHELLKVRPQATSLKNEIIQINSELQRSSENIQRKADELIKYRRMVCNTKTAIEHLQECIPVLETFSKLTQQMKEKKYYPALKTLEQFENLYIPKIRKYRFAQSMCQRVPKFRETIKKESMKDLKDFLENIRQLTSKIGEIAMKNVASQHKSKEFSFIINEHKPNGVVSEKMLKMPLSNGTMANSENLDDEYLFINEELSATDIVDFSPVYRCLHIFGCLGARDQFENYYRQQRKQQAKLILQSISSGPNSLFAGDNFRNYLFGVVGFFVIEDHLLNTSSGLVTKQYLSENWDDVIKSLVENVHLQASICHDPKQMLYMKSLLMLFCHTTQSYGYSVDPLMKLLVELRQLYIDILLRQWSQVFSSIFDDDNYDPLHVNNQQEFDEYFSDFPFAEMEIFKNHFTECGENNAKDAFPKKFPFSSFVPKVYKAIREFIATSLEFTQDLNLSNSDIEDTVRKSTNMLLTRTLSDSLSSLIKKKGLQLSQLIQISINTNYLEEASTYLEIYISDLIHNKTVTQSSMEALAVPRKAFNGKDQSYIKSISMNNEPSSHLARLQGRTMFQGARSEAEAQIYTLMHFKIDEFFGIANYNYLLTDSPGKASSYILDLMAFLTSTFEACTNLPKKVAQTACLSACKYIANRLLNVLIDDDVKSISNGFLQQFNLDLMQCEMFASSAPIKDFEEGTLQVSFTELRQIMDLFIGKNKSLWSNGPLLTLVLLTEFDGWPTYFAEFGKNESRYLRVQPQTALILLEKLISGDSKKNIFSSLSKNERDKKARIDTILKKLRTLTSSAN
ncbi:PREDICTED: exocyst complex component 6B-like [Rhagoletis zephyria]|uniref:exocyst complex component 6B-like n=1 Tax=Rhagoletis zephyria TaxID=28612 RepID=UPI0008118874|nr:PREDICTED: exocyst complex component 6B-like [Rhagoletis zephyria]